MTPNSEIPGAKTIQDPIITDLTIEMIIDTRTGTTTKMKVIMTTDMTRHARIVESKATARRNAGPKEVEKKAKYHKNSIYKDLNKMSVHMK